MAKKKKENNEVITSEQLRKFDRAARRQIDLERNSFIRGGAHKTAKIDVRDRTSNTVSSDELEELLEEEVVDEYEEPTYGW